MTLGNIVYLEEHGPVPVTELPHEITTPQRAEGLSCLTLYAGRGPAERVGGRLSPIAYLDAEHDPVAVVQALIEANPKLTEHKSRRGLRRVLGNQGQQWGEAATSVLDEYYESTAHHPDHQEAAETRHCPFCGETVTKGGLPDHLTGCPET